MNSGNAADGYYSYQKYKSNNNDSHENAEKTHKKKKLITIGKCSRFYLFILFSGVFKLLSLLILGDNNASADGIGLFGFCPLLYRYNFMQSIYTYAGYIIFGLIFYHLKGVKTLAIEKEKDENFDTVKREMTLQENYKIQVAKSVSNNVLRFKIFLLSLAIIVQIEAKKILYIEGFQFFNFWTIEIIFMQILMRKFFSADIYRHHKVSIIFVLSLGTIILLIASFLPTSLSSDNPGNSYQTIKLKLGSYSYSILFILLFGIISFVFCLTRIYSKVLMQYKFISPYKLIVIFGFVGLIISLICSISAYYMDYPDNLFDYYSSLKTILDEGNKYKFYGEIFLVSTINSFANFMEFTFEILTIYYLNPFYMLMLNCVYYFITQFISFMINLSSDGLIITHFFLTEFAELFSAFGEIVYLEILELNFWGLNRHLRKRIMLKGEDETRKLSMIDILPQEEENDDNEEENKSGDESKHFGDINRYRNI